MAEGRKEILGFVRIGDQRRFRELAMVIAVHAVLEYAVHHQIGHDRARRVVKSTPLFRTADHLLRRDASQYGTGAIPVRDPMTRVDHDGRHRIALNQLGQGNAVVWTGLLHEETVLSVG
ncbi:hypothetical protein SDC9_169452 [bioreactor metagenome]|uniref:Uncharacterized protein n=1 Tax=bioreactor metagenome TaxID=1076179 RepID=A0A645G8F5_9ZZZZ